MRCAIVHRACAVLGVVPFFFKIPSSSLGNVVIFLPLLAKCTECTPLRSGHDCANREYVAVVDKKKQAENTAIAEKRREALVEAMFCDTSSESESEESDKSSESEEEQSDKSDDAASDHADTEEEVGEDESDSISTSEDEEEAAAPAPRQPARTKRRVDPLEKFLTPGALALIVAPQPAPRREPRSNTPRIARAPLHAPEEGWELEPSLLRDLVDHEFNSQYQQNCMLHSLKPYFLTDLSFRQ